MAGHIQWGASTIRRCMSMVPAPGLQIDIFVTNFTPVRAPGLKVDHSYPPTPTTAMYDKEVQDLPPSSPGFVRGEAHTLDESPKSLDDHEDSAEDYIDLSYYTGEDHRRDGSSHEQGRFELDHEDHILDLTNFDGDNDEAFYGEEALNRSVKEEGTSRRAKTRRVTRATQASQQRLRERKAAAGARHHAHHGPHPTRVQNLSHESFLSTDRLPSPTTSRIEHRLTITEGDIPTSETPWRTPPTSPDGSIFGRPESQFSGYRLDTASVQHMLPRTGVGAAGQEVMLEVDEQSMHDINIVSEHARPGRPKFDRMIADEVENSKGSTIVACE